MMLKNWVHDNLGIIILMVVLIALSAAYTTWAVDISQHHWCATLHLLNVVKPPDVKSLGPAWLEYRRQLAAQYTALQSSFGCRP
jgi:hypothetical protein